MTTKTDATSDERDMMGSHLICPNCGGEEENGYLCETCVEMRDENREGHLREWCASEEFDQAHSDHRDIASLLKLLDKERAKVAKLEFYKTNVDVTLVKVMNELALERQAAKVQEDALIQTRNEILVAGNRIEKLHAALFLYKDVECKFPVSHFVTGSYGYAAREALVDDLKSEAERNLVTNEDK